MKSIDPKEPPKQTICARLTPRAIKLIESVSKKTRKTKSSIVDECVLTVLGGRKGAR